MDWTVPIVTFFAGMAAIGILEWFKARIDRKQTRKDRSDDFQRQTLLDLQSNIRSAVDHHWELGRLTLNLSGEDLFSGEAMKEFSNFRRAMSLVSILYPRVNNDQIVESFRELISAMSAVVQGDVQDGTPFSGQDITDKFRAVNELIGLELRKL